MSKQEVLSQCCALVSEVPTSPEIGSAREVHGTTAPLAITANDFCDNSTIVVNAIIIRLYSLKSNI